MKKLTLTCLSFGIMALLAAQTPDPVQIQVNASNQIATVTKLFNGSNIEDLNNQTNGGIFSQLIHGEAFEENVDIDFLNLPIGQYVQVQVILDEMRRPHFLSVANAYTRPTWNNLQDMYDFNSKDIYSMVNPVIRQVEGQPQQQQRPLRIGQLTFYGRFMTYDSIPANILNELESRINGDEQVSRYWKRFTSGNASYDYKLKRGDAYMGRQDQVIRFTGGTGEVGIVNAGLNKQGINLVAGNPYDGVFRVKATGPTTIYISLRDENGNLLAERPHWVSGDGSYEKVEFELTPSGSTPKGSVGISLKERGEIALGFAFMQPGSWGRVNDLPVRKEFVEALQKQGITIIRYNGSMVDVGADTYLYRWKKMIGPIDERRVVFRSGFNPFATHTFGLIEMAKVGEALGAEVMLGMSMDETYEDIRDFVEYMNGSVDTQWGRLRAEHGHPEPYNLKYIQVDNERRIDRGYVECMKKFALAAWEVDPDMNIMPSLNIGGGYTRGTPEYDLSSEMFGWFVEQGKSDQIVWDSHYSGSRNFADSDRFTNSMGIDLRIELEKDYPGHWLVLTPMEENGSRCDWDRGLAHAHNWNSLQRYGDHFRALGTANTLQPHGQHYMWDQGRVHYTSDEIWFQPSAHIDEMMTKDFLPLVVEATSSEDAVLDVTAKKNERGDSLSIYVVNLSDAPRSAVINVSDFNFSGRASTWEIGDCELTEYNTVDDKDNVAPKTGTVAFSRRNAPYTFPKYSYTVITLTR